MSQKIYTIRVALRGSKPPIWRKLAVPAEITLGQLHEVIQIAMGWTDSHLHGFTVKDDSLKRSREEVERMLEQGRWNEVFSASRGMRVFGPSTTPFGDPMGSDDEDEDAVTLAEVCPKVKSKLTYEYDFGDSWEHLITVQKIEDPKQGVAYPVCLSGKKASPPEDCGGIFGYYDMLEVINDPSNEGYEDCREWLGDDFDPEAVDLEEINACLAQWRGDDTSPNLRLVGG